MDADTLPGLDLCVDGDHWSEQCYLNTAAEGLLLRTAAEALDTYVADKARGEPGRESLFATHHRCRELAADLLDVPASRVALIGSATEGMNIAATAIRWEPGDQVVAPANEFPSNILCWVALRQRGVETRFVPPRDGIVHTGDLMAAITPRTRLVTISQVSYASGQTLDIDPLRQWAGRGNGYLLLDATQAVARVPVAAEGTDFLVSSSFKWLNSTHGSGILAVGQRVLDEGLFGPVGWMSVADLYSDDCYRQVRPRPGADRFQGGMPSFATVGALRAALEFHRPKVVRARSRALEPLVAELIDELTGRGLPVITPKQPGRQSGIVAFPHQNANAIKTALAERGIFVHADAGRVRASVHWYTRPDDIRRYLAALDDLRQTGLL